MQMLRIWIAATVVVMLAGSTQAFIVVQHTDDNDPATEGFSADGETSFGSAINDGGTKAWNVNDSAVGELTYSYTFNAQEEAGAVDQWGMSATVRLPLAPMGLQSNPFLHVRFDDDKRYFMRWTVSSGGTPSVQLLGSDSALVEVAGSGYHTYNVVYNKVDGTADVFADGNEVISDITPMYNDPGAEYFNWGSGASDATPGQGYFSNVSFSIPTIPEPASLALIGLGGLALLARRR